MLVTFVRHSESVNNTLAAQLGTNGVKDGPLRILFETKRHSDAPLTPRGVEQAERVGERVAEENGEDATLVICSYFHRALRTAAAIEGAVKKRHPESKLKVLVDRDFHEGGGMYRAVLKKKTTSTDASSGAEDERDAANEEEGSGASADGTSSSELDEGAVERIGFPGRTVADVSAEFPTFTFVPGQGCEDGWWKGPTKESIEQVRVRALFLWHRLADIARAGTHKSIVVVTHGHLYASMMKAAIDRGYFSKEAKTPANESLQNTGVTRVFVKPKTEDPTGAASSLADFASHANRDAPPATFELLEENCGKHVASIGALSASNLQL